VQARWWRFCDPRNAACANDAPAQGSAYTQHPVCSRSENIAHCNCKEAAALASNSRRVRLWPPRRDDRGHCVSQKVQHAEAPLSPRAWPGLHAASLWALALDTDLGDIIPMTTKQQDVLSATAAVTLQMKSWRFCNPKSAARTRVAPAQGLAFAQLQQIISEACGKLYCCCYLPI